MPKNNKKLEWHTEKRKIKDLIPYEHNPRRLTNEQYKQLKKSLEKFNLAEVPAIDTDNKIVAGHQRLATLITMGRGEEEIDVRIPNRKLTEEEFKEYNLRSNNNTGEWNWDELENWDEALLKDVGFDLEKEIKQAEKILVIEDKEMKKAGSNYFDNISKNTSWFNIGEISGKVKKDLLKFLEQKVKVKLGENIDEIYTSIIVMEVQNEDVKKEKTDTDSCLTIGKITAGVKKELLEKVIAKIKEKKMKESEVLNEILNFVVNNWK